MARRKWGFIEPVFEMQSPSNRAVRFDPRRHFCTPVWGPPTRWYRLPAPPPLHLAQCRHDVFFKILVFARKEERLWNTPEGASLASVRSGRDLVGLDQGGGCEDAI